MSKDLITEMDENDDHEIQTYHLYKTKCFYPCMTAETQENEEIRRKMIYKEKQNFMLM